jgi:hypothetical protein
VREHGEEDDRLLDRHRDAGDLLVGQVGEPPELRRRLVEVVDRSRQQREQESER